MKTSTTVRRILAATVASLAAVAFTAPAASAATGPHVFDSEGHGKALSIEVGLPTALADELEPAIEGLGDAGVSLEGGVLGIDLAQTLTEMQLDLDGEQPAEAPTMLTEAFSLSGSLEGLATTLTGGELNCLDSPVDVAVPPDAETPLVAFSLLQANCVQDAEGRRTIAASRVANLEVNLAGLIEQLPADVADELTGAIDEVRESLESEVIDPLVGEVQPILDDVGEELGSEIKIDDIVSVPDLLRLPIVQIDLLESDSRTRVDGERIVATGTTTLTGMRLLGGLACVPDVTYLAEAFATGQPGGNDYRSEIPPVRLGVCDGDDLSRSLLTILEQEGVINDVLVNTGGGDQSLAELLGGASEELGTLVDDLDALLGTLGVSSVAQGSEIDQVRSDDGRRAGVGVAAFRIGVEPLAEELADTPLAGTRVSVAGLPTGASVAAAPAPPEAAPAAPAPPLPQTGGGLAVLGLLSLGGALTMRHRGRA